MGDDFSQNDATVNQLNLTLLAPKRTTATDDKKNGKATDYLSHDASHTGSLWAGQDIQPIGWPAAQSMLNLPHEEGEINALFPGPISCT